MSQKPIARTIYKVFGLWEENGKIVPEFIGNHKFYEQAADAILTLIQTQEFQPTHGYKIEKVFIQARKNDGWD